MGRVTRLVTVVDLDDRSVRGGTYVAAGPPSQGAEPALAPVTLDPKQNDARRMSISALHLAILDDGRRLVLLSDRGWATHGPPDLWRRTSIDEIVREARLVVGPDEAYGDHSQADMAADHWAFLARMLQQQGVLVDAEELSQLPHDVELTERLRARVINA